MKLRDRVIEVITQVAIESNLENPENKEFLANRIIEVIHNEENSRELLRIALERYLKPEYLGDDELERLFAGILAFIWTNIWGEPYQPVYMYPVEEKPKKWWQFWK